VNYSIKMYLNLISQRAKIEGFIVFDYASRYHIAESEMAQWINEDKLKVQETRLEGIESCVDGLCGLFRGENLGKLVVKVGKAGEKL
jgi:NADPH-dependent curcumin reductase CurA